MQVTHVLHSACIITPKCEAEEKSPGLQGPGSFVWSSTLAATDTCHLRLNEGERSKFERAAGHLKISLSRLARDAWEWWLEQE